MNYGWGDKQSPLEEVRVEHREEDPCPRRRKLLHRVYYNCRDDWEHLDRDRNTVDLASLVEAVVVGNRAMDIGRAQRYLASRNHLLGQNTCVRLTDRLHSHHCHNTHLHKRHSVDCFYCVQNTQTIHPKLDLLQEGDGIVDVVRRAWYLRVLEDNAACAVGVGVTAQIALTSLRQLGEQGQMHGTLRSCLVVPGH